MYFDEEFIKSLPDDWAYAIENITYRFNVIINDNDLGIQAKHSAAKEVLMLIKVYSKKHKLNRPIPTISGDQEADITSAKNLMNELHYISERHIRRQSQENELKNYENIFEIALLDKFHYEFSEGDLKKIQELLNKLRALIPDTKDLEEDHKRRLLKKLEALQSELHKKVSDLDRFWGFFIDASIVVGKMGENAKPMVDIIKQIVSIIWPTQTRAYELSSDLPFKLLGQPEENKSKDDKS